MKQAALVFALTVFLPLALPNIAARAADTGDMSSRARQFAYCLRGSADGGMRCDFNSRAQCLKARNRGGSCIRNPNAPA